MEEHDHSLLALPPFLPLPLSLSPRSTADSDRSLAILFFVSSYNPAVCIIADTCCIGFLWIFGIGSVGSLSTVISWFRVASDYGLTFGG